MKRRARFLHRRADVYVFAVDTGPPSLGYPSWTLWRVPVAEFWGVGA